MANEVRVGLGAPETAVAAQVSKAASVRPLDELWFGKPIRQHVKEFGAIFSVIFLAVAGWKLLKSADLLAVSPWLTAATLFAGLGYLAPQALAPVWRGWMKLAHYLSVVMTFVVLALAWIIGFVPMSIIVRLCGVRVIDKSFDVAAESYWEPRDPKYDDFKRLERQY